MDRFAALNEVAKTDGRRNQSTLIKIKDLELNKQYSLTGLRNVTTKYGASIIAKVDDNLEFFLPKRIVDVLLNNLQDYESFNRDIGNGRVKFSYTGGLNECKFIYV